MNSVKRKEPWETLEDRMRRPDVRTWNLQGCADITVEELEEAPRGLLAYLVKELRDAGFPVYLSTTEWAFLQEGLSAAAFWGLSSRERAELIHDAITKWLQTPKKS